MGTTVESMYTNADVIERVVEAEHPIADDIVGPDSTEVEPRWSPRALKARVVIADGVALCSGVMLAFLIQGLVRPVPGWIIIGHVVLFVGSLPGFALGAAANRLYVSRANARRSQEAVNVAKALAAGLGVFLLLATAVKYEELSRLWLGLVGVSALTTVLIEREIVRVVFDRMRRNRTLQRRILIVGTDPHAVGLLHAYQRNPQSGYQVVGLVGDDDLGVRGGVRVVGPIEDLQRLLRRHDAVGVVVSQQGVSADDVNTLTRQLTDQGFHVALSSSLRDIAIDRLRAQEVDGHTMLYVEPIVRGGWRSGAKRAFDVAVAALILLLSVPVLAVAAVAIKLTSRGPVLFRQERVGRNGEIFRLYKLRTMVVDAEALKAELMAQNEADGPIFKMKRDPRVTSAGRVLRKFSIDELPQLWNVLRGDMSMVGPRPMLSKETCELDPTVLAERIRVLPGLTGLWQVSGRSSASFEQYARFDRYYVDNWSLLVDLRICVRTVGVVLTGRGAA
ncbi:MAG TPA: sugar transferase [Ilumatobacter sp.]|nr:sugar transferase [Ilumatobacter sp.]